MRASPFDHPPLQGEGRTAEGSPGWGDGDAAFAEALSPPPGPLARADLPPPRGGDCHRRSLRWNGLQREVCSRGSCAISTPHDWITWPSLRRAQLLHLFVRRQHGGAVDIFEI